MERSPETLKPGFKKLWKQQRGGTAIVGFGGYPTITGGAGDFAHL